MPPRLSGPARRRQQEARRRAANTPTYYGPGGDPTGSGTGQAQQKPPTTAEPGAKPTSVSYTHLTLPTTSRV